MFTMFTSLAAVLSLAAPAAADTLASTSSTVASVPAAKPVKAKVYCIVQTPTGTRVPQRTCHTRSKWADLGVDLDAD